MYTNVYIWISRCIYLYIEHYVIYLQIHDVIYVQVGLVDLEINFLAKLLFALSTLVSVMMLMLKGWSGAWVQSLVYLNL